MTLITLEKQIEGARAKAVSYAARCEQLVLRGDFAAVIALCSELSIEPPKFSLTAKTENALKIRSAAVRRLSNPKWWLKALEMQAIRQYEHRQILQGKVTNFVSDDLAAYHAKNQTKL